MSLMDDSAAQELIVKQKPIATLSSKPGKNCQDKLPIRFDLPLSPYINSGVTCLRRFSPTMRRPTARQMTEDPQPSTPTLISLLFK